MKQSGWVGMGLRTVAIALGLFAGALCGETGRAQEIVHATGPLPAFEVATVKPRPRAGMSMATMAASAATGGLGSAAVGNPGTTAGGGATAGGGTAAGGDKIVQQTRMTISFDRGPISNPVHLTWNAKALIGIAYGLSIGSGIRIVGGPEWIGSDSDRYEVQAKIDDTDFAALLKLPVAEQERQRSLMEQALLADRFKLKVHFETRDLPVYTLVVAKGGSKLTESKPDQHPLMSGVGDGQSNVLTGRGITMDQFVHSPLLRPEGRMVVDRTGLTGTYDFTLKSSTGMDAGAEGPSLFTAMEEQLGLKLVAGKAPLEVIVVDHIERPTAN